jgi:hypothetical protein
MKNVKCGTTPTPVLGPSENQLKRTVILQNQSAEIIYLAFTPDTGSGLSTSLGYQMAASNLTPLILSPTSPGGTLGISAISALSGSGNAILHVQHTDYTITTP